MNAMMKKMSERSYTAQVLRDETMAESIALHLDQHQKRKVLHLNGKFHSSKFLGTVERLATRKPELKIAVIETVTVAEQDDSWKVGKLKNGTENNTSSHI